MVSMKRSIAALIVCFKPHVLLTLCILLVIAHSIVITIQRGAGNGWRLGRQHDLTITMTTLVLVVALIWAAFFIFIVRFELRNELESLLVLFQCSKRGLRFLGVVGFHVALLVLVALVVSATVEKSIPPESLENQRQLGAGTGDNSTVFVGGHYLFRRASRRLTTGALSAARQSDTMAIIFEDNNENVDENEDERDPDHHEQPAMLDVAIEREKNLRLAGDRRRLAGAPALPAAGYEQLAESLRKSKIDRDYLLTVYKIWLTAIVYAFSYLVIENVIMFYADMSLIEFVHDSFLTLVAKLTGIDLSDYPAGEMLFNPLVRHRIR